MLGQLRTELKKIHKQFQHTMIYVTHDQTEALTFADNVIVMYEGSIVQIGTPQELFEQPQHTFVGKFIGSPGMNVLSCELQDSQLVLAGNTIDFPCKSDISPANLELGIRPEHIELTADRGIPVRVKAVEDVGKHIVVRTQLDDQEINVIVREGSAIPEDARVWFDPSKLRVYQDSRLVGD